MQTYVLRFVNYIQQEYEENNWCVEFGHMVDENGVSANEACCACGGGNLVEEFDTGELWRKQRISTKFTEYREFKTSTMTWPNKTKPLEQLWVVVKQHNFIKVRTIKYPSYLLTIKTNR